MIVSVACFPATLLIVMVAVVVTAFGEVLRAAGVLRIVRGLPAHALVIRSLWLLIAVVGLIALINDITAIT